MDIAKAKRKENIAEYILYLWQLEDLLRALQFSPEAIYSTLIAPRKDIAEEQKSVFLLWYMDLANLLRQEGKEEKGHLEHTLHLIQDLHDLHLQLMKLPVGEHYRHTFARLEPELPRLRAVIGIARLLLCGIGSGRSAVVAARLSVIVVRVLEIGVIV